MSYVITGACLGEQYAKCTEVCPADCIYPGEHENQTFMVIDPDQCINCHACLDVCPVNAIVASEEEAPMYAKLNKLLAPLFKENPKVPIRSVSDIPHKPHN